jgi:DNA-binding NarL/FixJ family response regulator
VTIRVLIADDHTLVRESLVNVLDASGECKVVAQAADGLEAVEKALQVRPDVAIVDISMPGLNGVEVVRRLHAELPATRTLVLTMHEDEEYVLHVVRAGAAGYLLKDVSPTDLRSAIRVVAAGESLLSPAVTGTVLRSLAERLQATVDDTPLQVLTEREQEVLALVGRGLSNEEIARELFLSPATARTYVSRLLTKLDARDRARLVVLAYETGLVVPGR